MNVTRPEIKQDLEQVVATIRPELEQQKQKMVDNAQKKAKKAPARAKATPAKRAMARAA